MQVWNKHAHNKTLVTLSVIMSLGLGGLGGTVAFADENQDPEQPSNQGADLTEVVPDVALRNCVNAHLGEGDASSSVSVENLKSLRGTLDCSNQEIKDITGLQHATNLSNLLLSGNEITVLGPLSALGGLTELSLDNNLLTDASDLAGLTELQTLNLYNNAIKDASPLRGMTKLTQLELHGNQLTDVTPLAGMTDLVQLGLSDNNVNDLAPLSEMTEMVSLTAGANQITDVSPLQGLTNMKHLTLYNNRISDLTPLVGMEELIYLDLNENALSDVSALQELPELSWLYLSGQEVVADPAPVGVPIVNPVKTDRGRPVEFSDFCTDSDCAQLIYPEAGAEVENRWRDLALLGRVDAAFSGRLVRDVLTPVTPLAPQLVRAETCGVESKVEIPEVLGASYSSTTNGSLATVTAAPEQGYMLAEGATSRWQFDLSGEPCVPSPPPTEPGVTGPGGVTPSTQAPSGGDPGSESALATTGSSVFAGAMVALVLLVSGLGLLRVRSRAGRVTF